MKHFLILVILGFSTQMCLSPVVAQEKSLSDEQAMLFWKGKGVVLLNPAPDQNATRICSGFRRKGKGREDALFSNYEGKTGTVTYVTHTVGSSGQGSSVNCFKFVITLADSIEMIEVDLGWVGFLAEKETAESFKAKALWTKGLTLIRDPKRGQTPEQIWKNEFWVPKTKRMTLDHVLWLNGGYNGLYLCFKTDDGKEGCTSGLKVDCRFFPFPALYLQDYFYSEDPRKIHPDWTKEVWDLIEAREVAVGMSQEMAEFSCGYLEKIGLVLSSADGVGGTIYRGCGKKILIDEGKVKKFVD